ncbi:MAG: malic enzyme-like NAD(P)-binding protein [Pseudomonadota bacterium]
MKKMNRKTLRQDALNYHSKGRPGKIEIGVTKPCETQRDLSLAYTPGVAEPCREIVCDENAVFDYTIRRNLVAVITNGTAVLGLGDIGPLASKPVMEGKSVLFKRFADVDAFDLEIDEKDPHRLIEIIKSLEPTFGGINLEDIKAPECFEIETKLTEIMDIPVFHDDQHGTAIITAAGFMNALELVDKKAQDVKVVFSGAGAGGVACARMLNTIGVPIENIWMCDRKGLVTCDRAEKEPHRGQFAKDCEPKTLEDALQDADAFVGLSVGGLLTKDMVKTMAKKPIIFAMANPDPEIMPEDAKEAAPDAIIATGRSDYPNQVNNVLGFPFIFRGALDVGARKIDEGMKLAAAHSLAQLAKEPVPADVCKAYGVKKIEFGPDYIIPKPIDSRVLLWEAPAVAEAAMKAGLARRMIEDIDAYRKSLSLRAERSNPK